MKLRLPLLFVCSIDYTQTHKKYTKVYLLFLSTFLPPIRGRHRFIPPRGDFPPFRSSKIYRVSMKKKYVPRKIKNPSGKGRKYTFVYGLRSGGVQRIHHGTHRRCEGSEGSWGSKDGGALWGADFKERGRG